ncbi:hypothetical protein FAM18108_00614 [Lacticaseibacillus paracasei]|nr:hypothetical protein [Lacticaseibacillus paracasei]RND49633.1 hypothetical protein FAM18108_00614 [Lacticaseibacillus paracasei]
MVGQVRIRTMTIGQKMNSLHMELTGMGLITMTIRVLKISIIGLMFSIGGVPYGTIFTTVNSASSIPSFIPISNTGSRIEPDMG